jgi:glycosyltransferase involved in cell wall biosynthesis
VRVLLIGGGVQPIPPTGYGAIERILADLKAALEAAGSEVVIVNRVRHRRMRDEYPFAWELPRLLRRERFDVLHAHTPVVGNRLAWSGLPYVYTTHSRHWYFRGQLSHRWGYWLERRAVRGSKAAIALTAPLAETMRRVVRPPLPPIQVIPFGVDTARFAPAWDRRTGRRVLGVGVVAPFKRWHLAAAALKGSGATLRIAGPIVSAEYAEEIRRIGSEVELLGEVGEDELERLFAESDLLVHPSAVEILSATVLEALSAGLPVVGGEATRAAVDDSVTGWVLPEPEHRFVDGMRQRVSSLLADDGVRRRMGEAARRVAEERYAWPAIAAQHLAVYRAVQERSAAGRG